MTKRKCNKKLKPAAQKKKVGRPVVVTENVVRKLEQAFCLDLSDAEACIFAGIGESTLYDFQKKNPEFSERKQLLKNHLSMQAKLVIASQINKGDEKIAQWWLERRRKNDYSTKQELAGNPDTPIAIEIIRRIVGMPDDEAKD